MAAPTLLVAGTASHVGKTTVAAGLCRSFARRGVDVVPFKAQNMSNNARAVPLPTALEEEKDTFGEIGIAQYVQARAANTQPTTDHNPVLLKPTGDGESQLIINGTAVGTHDARTYYDTHWGQARDQALTAWQRLAETHELVIAEGAGSIAEINLHDRDLANIEVARETDAGILLVADIERGGVFAAIIGTLDLLPEDVREQVIGIVITKFRGDRSLLADGIRTIENRTGVPVLGIVPYADLSLPEEDSLAYPSAGERTTLGADDGVEPERSVTIVVPRLPHMSNVPDIDPLSAQPGVRVSMRPPDTTIGDADGIVIPGSKNTVQDLRALKAGGFDRRLNEFDGPIVGLCGGYQMLGERITNAAAEGPVVEADTVEGLGLLPVETRFGSSKRVQQTELLIDGVGPLAGAAGRITGYEIHVGHTHAHGPVQRPFASPDQSTGDIAHGAARDQVLGTYLHGLFENTAPRAAFLGTVFAHAGIERPHTATTADAFDRVGDLIADHVDIDRLQAILMA